MDQNKAFFCSALRIHLFFRESYVCVRCPISDIAAITKLPCYLWDSLEDFTCDGHVRHLSKGTCSKQYKMLKFLSCKALLQELVSGQTEIQSSSCFLKLVLQSFIGQIIQPCMPTHCLIPHGGKLLFYIIQTTFILCLLFPPLFLEGGRGWYWILICLCLGFFLVLFYFALL